MTNLDRVAGIGPGQASLLASVGIACAEDLVRAEPVKVHRELEYLGRKRGRASQVPSLVTLKLWIKAARDLLERPQHGMTEVEEIPEAISVDDIPEAIVDDEASPTKAAVIPPTERRQTPAERAQAEMGGSLRELPPTSSLVQGLLGLNQPEMPTAPAQGPWKSVERSRFQSFEEYQNQSRGIQPLTRGKSEITDTDDTPRYDRDGKLSRWVRRGILYNRPFVAILGALVQLLWRLALLASLILLPWFLIATKDNPERPTLEITLWVGGLAIWGLLALYFVRKVRCRICPSPLFFSKRCIKNSRAHHIWPLGYVTSLCVHMLCFRWFRCMYCGTAMRLFGHSRRRNGDSQEHGDSDGDENGEKVSRS